MENLQTGVITRIEAGYYVILSKKANTYFTMWDFQIAKEKRSAGNWTVRTNFGELLCITRTLAAAKNYLNLLNEQS